MIHHLKIPYHVELLYHSSNTGLSDRVDIWNPWKEMEHYLKVLEVDSLNIKFRCLFTAS